MIIAIVQDSPEFNDKKATINKTIQLISDAKHQNADIVVFGETWLCGYPIWLDICPDAGLWDHEPVKEVWHQMHHSSIDISSIDLDSIKHAAKEHNIWVVIGMNEKISIGPGNGTLYNSVATISNKGELVNHHRKLMPTFTEKLVHGQGDGAGLKGIDTSFGRIGSLICWEHWMPLSRQAMHDEAEDLHIALWPTVKEMNQICARQYAFEGRCHVVSIGQILHAKQLPSALTLPKSIDKDQLVMTGGSSIYGPDGDVIMDPVYDRSGILYQELDLSKNIPEKMNLSVSGHYQRPDVFDFKIDKKRIF